VFASVLEGQSSTVKYSVNKTQYNIGYYLSDNIYLEQSTLVKTIPISQGDKRKLFAQHQEGGRKDVERAFGVLQSRFAVICGPICNWLMDTIKHVLYACIIIAKYDCRRRTTHICQ